jgi:hypothetical protein
MNERRNDSDDDAIKNNIRRKMMKIGSRYLRTGYLRQAAKLRDKKN